MKSPRWCYHLDTSYVIPYLEQTLTPSDRDQSSQASEVLGRVLSKDYSVKICMTTIGEFFEVLAEKDRASSPQGLLERLLSQIKNEGKINIYRPQKSELGRLTDLVNIIKSKLRGRSEDSGIGPTDIMILAHSMVDKDCKGLITFDNPMLNSKCLKDVITKHIKNRKGFSITDRPRI